MASEQCGLALIGSYDVNRLRGRGREVEFCYGMNASGEEPARQAAERQPARRLIRPIEPRGRPSRDLPLVKWSAWVVAIVFVLLVILVVWGLARHGPSQVPFNSGD